MLHTENYQSYLHIDIFISKNEAFFNEILTKRINDDNNCNFYSIIIFRSG